jgi:uncharacterized protein
LRFVLDTNLIVSAALVAQSVSRRAFDRALDRGAVLLSLPVLAEINDVLGREKFRRYVSEDEAERFLASLSSVTEWVEVTASITACRDPSDNKFLELALSGEATHIVTGDKDLLSLNPFRGVAIVTPGELLKQF